MSVSARLKKNTEWLGIIATLERARERFNAATVATDSGNIANLGAICAEKREKRKAALADTPHRDDVNFLYAEDAKFEERIQIHKSYADYNEAKAEVVQAFESCRRELVAQNDLHAEQALASIQLLRAANAEQLLSLSDDSILADLTAAIKILSRFAGSPIKNTPKKVSSEVADIYDRIREMLRDDPRLTHREICDRLANTHRPPRTIWSQHSWPIAFEKFNGHVHKWISNGKAIIRNGYTRSLPR